MLNLERIEVKDNLITMEYYPEGDSNDKGFIKYDKIKKKVIEFRYTQANIKSKMHIYFNKAVNTLEDMIEEDEVLKSKLIMWY